MPTIIQKLPVDTFIDSDLDISLISETVLKYFILVGKLTTYRRMRGRYRSGYRNNIVRKSYIGIS